MDAEQQPKGVPPGTKDGQDARSQNRPVETDGHKPSANAHGAMLSAQGHDTPNAGVSQGWADLATSDRRWPETSGQDSTRAPGQVLEQSRTEAAVLASLIDGEVVPRLLMVRGVMPGLRASAIEGVVTSTLAQNSSATQAAPCAIPQDTSIATAAQRVAASARVGEGAEAIVSKVAALSLSADAAPLGEYMDTLRLSGLPLEDVFLGVLGPAAKWLGRQWDEDEISFTDVTLGLGRLQALFDRMRHERGGDPTHAMATNAQARGLSAEMRGTSGRAIMLATVPGEHHTFGLAIAEHMFFEAGWRVEAITGVSQFELMRRIEDAQVDIVALSLSSHALVPSALALIAAIRRTPRLRGVRIMVSGALATHEPNLRAMLGVDTIATDGPGAIVLAETLAAQRQIAD